MQVILRPTSVWWLLLMSSRPAIESVWNDSVQTRLLDSFGRVLESSRGCRGVAYSLCTHSCMNQHPPSPPRADKYYPPTRPVL